MEENSEKRGRGRPKKDGSRHEMCNVRLDESERDMIEYFVEYANMSRSDIIRSALKLYFNINKGKY